MTTVTNLKISKPLLTCMRGQVLVIFKLKIRRDRFRAQEHRRLYFCII